MCEYNIMQSDRRRMIWIRTIVLPACIIFYILYYIYICIYVGTATVCIIDVNNIFLFRNGFFSPFLQIR